MWNAGQFEARVRERTPELDRIRSGNIDNIVNRFIFRSEKVIKAAVEMPKAKRKKHKFIDKKADRTTTFALVHRSQRDPLAADPDAPQRVLQPISHGGGGEASAGPSRRELHPPERVEMMKEEERKYGIFFDDDYDYMQHVRESGTASYDYSELDRFESEKASDRKGSEGGPPATAGVPGPSGSVAGQLPRCVFGSSREVEEEVGLLNKAAPISGPRIDWDPDIVETLDDDFDGHEVVLTLKDGDEGSEADEDDLDTFLREANRPPNESEGIDDDDEDDDDEDEEDEEDEDDEVGSLDGFASRFRYRDEDAFAEEETRSRFTEYSMSSSVIRRNAQLTLLDDKFDHFFAEYDDSNVGGLECDDIEGCKAQDSALMKMVVKDCTREAATNPTFVMGTDPDKRVPLQGNHEDLEKLEIDDLRNGEANEDRLDCQSVLSTYSNLYNRPKVIKDPPRKVQPIKVISKTGIPKDVLGKGGLTVQALKRLDQQNALASSEDGEDDDDDEEVGSTVRTLASRVSELSFRNKHETPEERKVRKGLAKELRRERRVEKKANKTAFKEEKRRQDKVEVNNRRNAQMGDTAVKIL